MTTPTVVVAVVQCKQWGDDTRKIRIKVSNDASGDLSYTGEELQHEILAKIRCMLGHPAEPRAGANNDDGRQEWVEIYDDERECFVSLKHDGLYHANIGPIFGRLVRCIAHLRSDFVTFDKNMNNETQDQQTPPLAIMGRYFHYDPNGMDYCGKQLVVKERSNDLEEDGTGLNIWDGAILLAKYLELRADIIKGKRVLELGSGPGFVGIAAGFAGASEVILTDLPYCLPLMEDNVLRNMDNATVSGCEKMECRILDWYDPPSDLSHLGFASDRAPDVILIADCVWVEELVDPLIQTIQQILRLSAPTEPKVVMSYQQRGKGAHEAFMKGLEDTFDRIVEVGDDAQLNKPDVLHIFECWRSA